MDIINLNSYDSSDNYSSIESSLRAASDNILTIENLSHKVNFCNEFYVYDENILKQYKNYLSNFCIWLAIPENYYYKPELVAKKIYGSVDLWYLVLWFSNIPSAMEFNQDPIRVFNPSSISVLNSIINKNRKAIRWNHKFPDYLDDLTLKEVKIKDTRL